MQPGANSTSVAFLWKFDILSVEVRYSLVSSDATFVEKRLAMIPMTDMAGMANMADMAGATHNVTRVTLFRQTSVTRRVMV